LGLAAFVKTAIVELPVTAVGAAAKNPVVALAMATAFAKLYAKQSGKSLQEVVETAALKASSAAAQVVTGQIQSGVTAFEKEVARGREATRSSLMSALRKNFPPARKSSRSRTRGTTTAEKDAAEEKKREEEAALTLAEMRQGSSPIVAPPPAAAAPGGRRKTRGRKSKRRVTRRKVTLVKFAY
jgi:hypothetical protein